MTRREYDAGVMEFLFYNEHLVDIHDDLYDYEKDVARGSFNVFRCPLARPRPPSFLLLYIHVTFIAFTLAPQHARLHPWSARGVQGSVRADR